MTRLDETIRDVLDLEPDADLRSISYRGTPAWDSVAHLRLVVALEEEFHLTFGPDELMEMTDYDQVKRTVEQRQRDTGS